MGQMEAVCGTSCEKYWPGDASDCSDQCDSTLIVYLERMGLFVPMPGTNTSA